MSIMNSCSAANPFRDAPIDLIQRGRHNVALARLRVFALGFHTPPSIKRILGLLRRDTEFSVKAIPALEHCQLAQLIARRGGKGLGSSLTSSASSRAHRNAPFVWTASTRACRAANLLSIFE
jgi:hypothetical protein